MLIPGTSTGGRCKDSGQPNNSLVTNDTQVIGKALTVATVGNSVTLQLFGPGHYGADLSIAPTSTRFIDDFYGGNATTGSIGQLGWQISTIGSAPALSRNAPVANHPGAFLLQTAVGATAGQGGAVSLGQSAALTALLNLGGTTNWESYIVTLLSQTTATRYRVGFVTDITASPPIIGIWARYDTNSSPVYSDTTGHFTFECSSVVGSQKTIDTSGNSGAVRASNVATITTTAAHGFSTNNIVRIAGVTDTVFNGVWVITSTPTTTTFTYANTGSDGTSGSGTADAAIHTTANSTVAVDTSYHTLHMRSITAGTVLFSIDGEAEISIASNCPQSLISPAFDILTDTTAQKQLVMDFFSFRQTGLSR